MTSISGTSFPRRFLSPKCQESGSGTKAGRETRKFPLSPAKSTYIFYFFMNRKNRQPPPHTLTFAPRASCIIFSHALFGQSPRQNGQGKIFAGCHSRWLTRPRLHRR